MRKPFDGESNISSEFGNRRFQLSDGSWYSDFHTGIDNAGYFTVLAAAAGKVIATATNGIDRGGQLVKDTPANYIIIDHGNNIKTMYWHLSVVAVNVGDYVQEGQSIGVSGRTGEATGLHLHFIVQVNGQFVNPRNYVNFDNNNYNVPIMNGYDTKVYGEPYYYVQPGDSPARIVLNLGMPDSAQNMNYLAQINGFSDYEDMRKNLQHSINIKTGLDKQAPATNHEVENLKKSFEKERQELIVKYQKLIEEQNASSQNQINILKENLAKEKESYELGLIDTKAQIAAFEITISELENKIKLRQDAQLFVAGVDIAQLGSHLLEETFDIKKNVFSKYYNWIDKIFPNKRMIREFLKFDILIIFGANITNLVTAFATRWSIDPALLNTLLLSATIVKQIITRQADTNGDGKLGVEDTYVVKQFMKES